MRLETGWRAQPYPAEGGTAAEGIRSQLGRPDLDMLTVLVREAAQNSWDARLDGRQVRFRMELSTVGPAHIATWRESLARGIPTASGLPLREKLRGGSIRLLVVSDRGTSGLGGPTRADQHAPDERDFISFIRNVGEPRDKVLGGGTYGFGKSVFYLLAQSGAVLVHTRCVVDGRPETRLIGCALWQSYQERHDDGSIRPYTGRHWWGELAPDIVEPLTGDRAEAMARAFGLPDFAHDETGTDVVVIDPDLDGRTPREAAGYIAETMAWQLWPKMIAADGKQAPMSFSVVCDGTRVAVPDPELVRPLSMFVSAYRKMVGTTGRTLACHKPVQDLGRLGLHRGHLLRFEPTPASTMVGIEDGLHHVCLMRAAELVVRYYPGPRPPSRSVGYAGVFKAAEELDDVYARAEPPTHDNWVANQLVDRERTFVRMTFKRIDEQLDKFAEPGNAEHSLSASTPLGAASSLFSSLVGGAWGDGGATDYIVAHASAREPDVLQGQNTAVAPSYGEPSLATSESLSGRGHDRPGGMAMTDTAPAIAGSELWQPPPLPSDWSVGRPADARSTIDASNAARHDMARNPRVQFDGDPMWERRDGFGVVVQRFVLPAPGWQRVRALLAVSLSGTGTSRETDPPVGAARPVLIAWESSDGVRVTDQSLETYGGDGRRWLAVVRPAPDTITDIDLRAEPLERVVR